MSNDEAPHFLSSPLNRREFVGIAVVGGMVPALSTGATPAIGDERAETLAAVDCTLSVNGEKHVLQVDPRSTLLDVLRETLHLNGTKKGCDHGQCGACTVLVNGKRVNSCLSLAVMNDGYAVKTIEGMSTDDQLHPMQAAFVEYDGLQCGYCTPGQICSAIAMLDEVKRGALSFVTPNISEIEQIELTDEEIHERMSGNICRCGAYVGIVAAIRSVHEGRSA